jgi:hypothetical protein
MHVSVYPSVLSVQPFTGRSSPGVLTAAGGELTSGRAGKRRTRLVTSSCRMGCVMYMTRDQRLTMVSLTAWSACAVAELHKVIQP